jgi:hypothetical protein
MTTIEFVGALVSSFGVGWLFGRAIKAVRQFMDMV